MSDKEKIAELANALREINREIFAVGAPLGSSQYFRIRGLAVDTLNKVVPEADGRATL